VTELAATERLQLRPLQEGEWTTTHVYAMLEREWPAARN
jgi:hypothetical protein